MIAILASILRSFQIVSKGVLSFVRLVHRSFRDICLQLTEYKYIAKQLDQFGIELLHCVSHTAYMKCNWTLSHHCHEPHEYPFEIDVGHRLQATDSLESIFNNNLSSFAANSTIESCPVTSTNVLYVC